MKGPLAALQSQHALARWWGTPIARVFADGFGEKIEADGFGFGRSGVGETAAHLMPDFEPHTLPKMPTYSVAADMVTLVEAAAQSFPGQVLHREDLPSETGFVLLDRPIELLDVSENQTRFSAFTWEQADVQRIKGGQKIEQKGHLGIFLAMYSDLDDIGDYERRRFDLSEDKVAKLQREAQDIFGSSGLVLLHVHGIQYDFEYDVSEVKLLQNHLAFIESLWAIMQQKITLRQTWRAPRGMSRSIERAHNQPPEVQVITLRRIREATPEEAEEPGFVDWSHRWLVSGHWRHVWNEARHEMRLVWISPYIKGPEDKPLVLKDKVFRLSR